MKNSITTSFKQSSHSADISAPWNADTPFLLVDVGSNDPTRGDCHGSLGIAQKITEKIGARLEVIDDTMLEDLYPAAYERGRREALKKYISDHGYPDMYFNTDSYDVIDTTDESKFCMLIDTINEGLAEKFLGDDSTKFVPHHLTPEILAYEGRKFAEEYAELPRPFIGINLIHATKQYEIIKYLASLKQVWPQATFFVCGCHRTRKMEMMCFLDGLRSELADTSGNFPVMEFNYNDQVRYEGIDHFWNPYIGMLDQADHLILLGDSLSMYSECLATGKQLHTANRGNQEGAVNLSKYIPGKPLVTKRIEPVDITGKVCDAIIEQHAKSRKEKMEEQKIGQGYHSPSYDSLKG